MKKATLCGVAFFLAGFLAGRLFSLRDGFFHAVGWGSTIRGRAEAETDAEAEPEPGPEGRRRRGGGEVAPGARQLLRPGSRLQTIASGQNSECGVGKQIRAQSDPNRRSGRSQIRAAIRAGPQSEPNRRSGRSKIRAADPGCFLSKTSPADWSHGAACRPGPGRSPPGSARRSGRAPAPEPRHSIATGRGSR